MVSGLEHKYHYEIIGHSGESHKITFVGPGSVTDAGSSDGMPRTRGDRLAVVQEMYSRKCPTAQHSTMRYARQEFIDVPAPPLASIAVIDDATD